MSCGCNSTPCLTICDSETGCPVQLDFSCVLYHKSNNDITGLTNLGLSNGATLNQFADLVDVYIGQIKASAFTLPCLRDDYTINSLKQFAEAVDTELCAIKTTLGGVDEVTETSLTAVDSPSINLTVSGTANHTVKADAIISPTAGNRLSILSDGLYASPQTLSVNYATKELTIVGGNTVNLASLSCGVGGFLGNVTSDPSAIDGQYWYNTTSSQLKIKVGGAIKVITTT